MTMHIFTDPYLLSNVGMYHKSVCLHIIRLWCGSSYRIMFLLALVLAEIMAADAINCPDIPNIPNITSAVYSDAPHSDGSTVTISCVATPFVFIPTPSTPISCIGGSWETIPKCSDPNELQATRGCSTCSNGCEHISYPGWCSGGLLLSGDLNGDGYCDHLCHSPASHVVYIVHYNNVTRSMVVPAGAATPHSSLYAGTFCTAGGTVLIRDANRDGYGDVLCIQNNSTIQILWGTPNGILSLADYTTTNLKPDEIDCSIGYPDKKVDCSAVLPCHVFTITNGEFVYDEVTSFGKAACDVGFNLRGLSEFVCQQDGNWYGPVPPICEPHQPTSLMNIYQGKSLAEFDFQQYQVASDSRKVKLHECLWRCAHDQKCSTARFDETSSTCDLFSINPRVTKATFLTTAPNINLIVYQT